MRHAKSSWDQPDLADHDRPLSPRGVLAAEHMARYLQGQAAIPDLVLCSTARRCRNTLGLMGEVWGRMPPHQLDPELYLCGAHELLYRIRQAPDADALGGPVNSLLVLAHNPDVQELVLHLIGGSDPKAARQIEAKFPTAAVAIFALELESWQWVSSASARLSAFMAPKLLPSTEASA